MSTNDPKAEELYPCPKCAEKVLFEANQCRFCNAELRKDIHLRRKPKDVTSFAKSLFPCVEKSPHPSYGSLRRELEKESPRIACGVNQKQVKTIRAIVETHGGSIEALPYFETTSANEERVEFQNNPPSWPWALGLILISIFGGIFAWKMSSSNDSTKPQAESKAVEKLQTLKREGQETKITNETTTSTSKNPTNPIRDLLQATATIRAGNSTGSGFFVHEEGFLLTNHHVIGANQQVRVRLHDGTERVGKLLRTQESQDLALIKVEGGPYSFLPLGDATTLEPGESVWTIGAPRGLEFSVNKGIVSYVGRMIRGKAFIQADVAINPGNSGGPMINEQGEVIGINNFIISDSEGLNFSIPINFTYSGSNAILSGILPTQKIEGTLASWINQEEVQTEEASSTLDHSTAKGNGDILLQYQKEMKDLNRNFEARSTLLQKELHEIDENLNQTKAQYEELVRAEGSLDETERLEQEFSSFQKKRIEKQIELYEETQRFTGNMEAVLYRFQANVQVDSKEWTWSKEQLSKILQLRQNTEAQLEKARGGQTP